MATSQEKLAESLEALRTLQDQGRVAIRSEDLNRTHREHLVKNGDLQEVMKGWNIPADFGVEPGDSTAWYASYLEFSAAYLNEGFGTNWCLAPDRSLSSVAALQ